MSEIQKVTLLELNVDGDEYFLFDGEGRISVNSRDYVGIGLLAEAAPQDESVEAAPQEIEISLTGVEVELLSIAMTDSFQYGEIVIKVATLDYPDMTLRRVFTLFDGYMSHMQIVHDHGDRRGSLSVGCFTELQNQNLSAALRYTDKSQRRRDESDTAMTRLPEGAAKEVIWGRGRIR